MGLQILVIVAAGDVVASLSTLVVVSLTFLSLRGLVKKKAYFHLYVWKGLFFIQVMAFISMLMLFLSPTTTFNINYLMTTLPYFLLNIIFIGPAIYGTYWYAFKYKSIWKESI